MSCMVLLFLSLAPVALGIRVADDLENDVASVLRVEQMTPKDRDRMVDEGIRELSNPDMDCPNLPHQIEESLGMFLQVLQGQCDNITNACRTNFTLDETYQAERAFARLNSALYHADTKGCAAEVVNHPAVQPLLAAIDGYRPLFELADDVPGVRDRTLAVFSQMASWQQALVALGDSVMDPRLRFSEDQQRACDSACYSCDNLHSASHASEPFRFKCILKRRYELPSGPGIHCLPAARRVSRPWAFKSWCTNQDWVEWHFQSVRISAMSTCASHSLVARILSGSAMPDQFMRSCMLLEQGQALAVDDLRAWKAWIEDLHNQRNNDGGDGLVSEGWRATLLGYFAISTAEGLAGLREASENNTRLSPEDWTRLFQSDEFNVLPQGLVATLDCAPTLYQTTGQRLQGMFAILGAGLVGVASLVLVPVAMLGSIALFLLGTYTAIFARCRGHGDWCFNDDLWWIGLGGALTSLGWVPAVSGNWAFKAFKPRYTRPHLDAACAGGLLQLGNSTPACIKAMDVGDALKVDCPSDSARSMVVSCDREFGHFLVVRGGPC